MRINSKFSFDSSVNNIESETELDAVDFGGQSKALVSRNMENAAAGSHVRTGRWNKDQLL